MAELTETEQRQIFDSNANDPMQWLATADNNLIAADHLDAARAVPVTAPISHIARTGTVSLMLRAFAIECLIKGIYVKTGGRLAAGGSLAPGFPQQHRLVEM